MGSCGISWPTADKMKKEKKEEKEEEEAERRIFKANINYSSVYTRVVQVCIMEYSLNVLHQYTTPTYQSHFCGVSRPGIRGRGNVTHSDSFGVKLITSPVNYVTFICTLHLPRNLGCHGM